MVVVNMMCGTGSCYQVTSSDSCCGDDRISSLPESVMSHILSRLPTKEAVQTCVLSTDWKYKWTSIYNVSINDHAPNRSSKKEIESDFFDFMEKMSLLCFSHNVRSFSLWCFGYYDFARMSTWISAVLGPKLETFQLLYAYEGFVIPKGLLNCTSLKTLQLMSRFTFKFPAVHNFPNLVDLHLDKVNILLDNEDSSVITSSTMILKFPVLKSLKLRLCKWLNVKIVEIHAPALTELSSESDWKVDDKSSNYYSIKVVGASRLSKFLTEKGLHDNFIFTGGSKVDFAAFNSHTGYELDSKLYGDFALQVRRLLNELSSSSINYLMLSTYTAEAIAHPNPELPLPRYV